MKFVKAFFVCIIALGLSACATSLGQATSDALKAVGLSKDTKQPDAPKEISVRIFGGNNLNADQKGRPLAVVVKLYKLRDDTSFISAPYEALSDSSRERQVLGQDLIDSRELVLTPGQDFEFKEKLPPDAGFFAVAAFFRAPAPERWHYSFAVGGENLKGITVGVHACALTVSQGIVHGPAQEGARSLNGVSCRAAG